MGKLKILRQPASADFWVFSTSCFKFIQQKVEKFPKKISWENSKICFNPLGSEVILGPLRCFDMPWYLCLFQLLITYYWPTCGCFCIQHKLCYNNMWPRWMYMFAFFRKKILCVVSKFWEKKCSWNKAIKPTLNSPE